MLRSPTTSDANGAGSHGAGGPDLRTAVSEALMPTPRAGDGDKGGPNQRGSSGDLMLPSAVTMLPTPTSRDWKDGAPCDNVPDNALLGRVIHHLLPTPAVNDMDAAYEPGEWDAWTARMKAAHNNGNGHGNSLNIEAQRLDMLPTPSVADATGGHETRSGARSGERLLPGVAKYELLPTPTTEPDTANGHARNLGKEAGLLPTTTTRDGEGSGGGYGGYDNTTLTDATVRQPSRWGKYAAAIAKWEAVTRPAPDPTTITDGYLRMRAKRLAGLHKKPVGMRGSLKPRRQLAARFSEWMMGVPLGWITDTPGITRNEALKAAGNGVVPQQAAEALRFLLEMPTGRDIAAAHEPVDLFELLERA